MVTANQIKGFSSVVVKTTDGPVLAINASNRAMGEPDHWEISWADQEGPESVFECYTLSGVVDMINTEKV